MCYDHIKSVKIKYKNKKFHRLVYKIEDEYYGIQTYSRIGKLNEWCIAEHISADQLLDEKIKTFLSSFFILSSVRSRQHREINDFKGFSVFRTLNDAQHYLEEIRNSYYIFPIPIIVEVEVDKNPRIAEDDFMCSGMKLYLFDKIKIIGKVEK